MCIWLNLKTSSVLTIKFAKGQKRKFDWIQKHRLFQRLNLFQASQASLFYDYSFAFNVMLVCWFLDAYVVGKISVSILRIIKIMNYEFGLKIGST